MSFKVPTFHDAGEQGNIDETELKEIENKNHSDVKLKSFSTWMFFWFGFSAIVYLIMLRVNPNSNILEIVGYVDLSFGGLLVYTNAIGGSQFMAGGGLVDSKIIMRDYVDSRARVFSKWMGPTIGVLLGILMVFIDSL